MGLLGIPGWMFGSLGPLVGLLLIVAPAMLGWAGAWLIWTGMEHKSWWGLRFAVGTPLAIYAVLIFIDLIFPSVGRMLNGGI